MSKTGIRPFDYVPDVPDGGMTVSEFCGWLEQWKVNITLAYSQKINNKRQQDENKG
jgi:hypothetical protein